MVIPFAARDWQATASYAADGLGYETLTNITLTMFDRIDHGLCSAKNQHTDIIHLSDRDCPDRVQTSGDKMTTQATLRTIPDSETFSAQTRYLGGRKVEATFSIRRDAKSARYEKKATFDFSNVTEEELYLLAMYACKVKLQALLRNLSPEVMTNAQTLASIDVKRDPLEADKATADPVTAAVRSIQKATGLDEGAAKALLDQAKSKTAAVKPQQKAEAIA